MMGKAGFVLSGRVVAPTASLMSYPYGISIILCACINDEVKDIMTRAIARS